MMELMRFWLFSGFLLAGAAWSLDTLLRGRGVQLRGIWASAMGLTLLSPILPRISAWTPSRSATAPEVFDGAPGPSTQVGIPLNEGLADAVILGSWGFVSAALIVTGGLLVMRLHHRSRAWKPARVGGEDVLVAPDFGPAVIGLTNTRIVLPASLCTTDSDDLDLILRHEKEHIDAGDPTLLMGAAIAAAVMPWNLPLVWQAWRLRAAVEEDCDLRVVRSGACRRSYADLLLRMASRSAGFGFAAAPMSERRSGLRRRLERLRDRDGQTGTTMTALLVIAGASAIAVWVGLPSPVSHLGHRLGLSDGFATGIADLAPLPPVAPLPPLPPLDGSATEAVRRHSEELKARRAKMEEHLQQVGIELKKVAEELERTNVRRRSLDTTTPDGQAASNDLTERLRDQTNRLASLELSYQEGRRHLEQLLQKHEQTLARMRERRSKEERAPEDGGDPWLSFEGGAGGADIVVGGQRLTRLGLPPTFGSYRLINVDGVPFDGALRDIPPDFIDRIEIFKDAATHQRYGDAAKNGVINIFLKPGAPPPGSD